MHATRRPIQTRFRCASTYRLKLAAYTKSLTHYTKGTPSLRLIKSLRGFAEAPLSLLFVPQVPGGVLRTPWLPRKRLREASMA